ncbi:MAG: hypothetical protein IOD12_03630 [Silvanigrellales bacterium]|nr:hypothetical protein [Silvanigrellales bacterium]
MKTLLAMLEAARVLAPLAANAGPFVPSRETLHAFVQGLIAHADGGGLTGQQASLVVRAWRALMARRESVDALRRLGNLEVLAEVAARLERHAERTRGTTLPDNAPQPRTAEASAQVLSEVSETTFARAPLDMDALVVKAAGLFSGVPNLFGYLCVSEQGEPDENARCLLVGTQGEGTSLLSRKDLVLASKRWSHITRVIALPHDKSGQTKIVFSLFTFADKRTFENPWEELQNLLAQPVQHPLF